MAIAELFIGAFITVLFEKLAAGELIKLARSAGIYSELEKLKNNLTLIQAVLADATQKQIRDTAVQFWLNELQHLAYEIDDVLDDLATEVMRHQLNQENHATTSKNTSKVFKFFPTKFHALKYRSKMSSKLDGITAKLRDLIEKKNILGLNDKVEISNRTATSRLLEETSSLLPKCVIGRESDKEALLGMLLGDKSSSSENVSVLSIVGMGGIGKTTLAQLLYNDKKVKSHFELKSWVCVSHEFDVSTISKTIYSDVGGEDSKLVTPNQLQVALSEKLSKKRFLIVLDDVWNENDTKWEFLQRPLSEGAPGSKILVTTRKTLVASVMDSVQAYHLDLLSKEEALSSFAQHASSGKQNFDVNEALELHGEDIIKKCGRLPLALKTLGSVFKNKINVEEWEELLNSEIWNLDKGNEVLPALKLSYYDLLPHLKQMFAYSCLFSKDYMFDKDKLVLLWMAEGFLYDSNRKCSMEDFGRECFEELVSRSFFQHSPNNKPGYTMHDLIHDLAISVAGEFFLMLDATMDVDDKHEALEKIHHLSVYSGGFGAYTKFKALQKARRMRTLLATPFTRLYPYQYGRLSNKVLIELLPQLQFLRVLSITTYAISEVPHSIGSLKHLRYLNFSNTSIACLPEQVGGLHNLQSLLLSRCRNLSNLPNSIVKLTKLRHLEISDTPKLNKLPLGIDRLTSLRTLSKVIIGGSGDFRISNLKGLLYLCGQLSIEGLEKVKNAVHAKEANLLQKKGICDLQMKWSADFDDSQHESTEYEVLEGLRPFEKLKSLVILYYNGTKFPTWVGDPSFVSLTQLTLSGCRSCTCLPTLGYLPSLQKLSVKSMYGLKRVGSELLGHGNFRHGVAFPSLEVLEFNDMCEWEEWSTSGGDKVGMFPCLQEISISDCPKLDVVVIGLLPSLQTLRLMGCSLAVLRSIVFVSSIATLYMCNIKGLTQVHGEVLEHLRALECLIIDSCSEITYLWESEAAACKILLSLKKLELIGCANLVSLGEVETHMKSSMESVTEVRIINCPRLESYNCPNNIEKLHIAGCPLVTSLTSSATDDLPSTFKHLSISNCDSMEVSWLLNNFFSSLESLYLLNMPSLRLFPEGCLIHLTKLSISGCDTIEYVPDNGYGFLSLFCLRELCFMDCKNLKSFPHEHLQSLTSLEQILISNCPSLDYSFPCGFWPPNLSCLRVGELKKPISEWGMQNFPTSLVTLTLIGINSRGFSFAKAEEDHMSSSSFLLPSSLTDLRFYDCMELETVSEGLQHLTCLQHLYILNCPKLRDLPQTLLSSLSSLCVSDCSPGLKKKCSRKGKYWPIISQIPFFSLD